MDNSFIHRFGYYEAILLEKLNGNLKDLYSIRINDQWRIVFEWNSGNAEQVQVVDYH